MLHFSLDGKKGFTQMGALFTLTTVRLHFISSVFVFAHVYNPCLPFSLCQPGHFLIVAVAAQPYLLFSQEQVANHCSIYWFQKLFVFGFNVMQCREYFLRLFFIANYYWHSSYHLVVLQRRDRNHDEREGMTFKQSPISIIESWFIKVTSWASA